VSEDLHRPGCRISRCHCVQVHDVACRRRCGRSVPQDFRLFNHSTRLLMTDCILPRAARRDLRTGDQDRQRLQSSGHDNTALRGRLGRSSLRTQQAREWWDKCTASKLSTVMTFARKWLTAIRHDTQWQTIHVPERVFEEWRSLACESGAKVSDFDLFASWIQLVGAPRQLSRSTRQSLIHPLASVTTEPRRVRVLSRHAHS
jgi:hypothetical protein